MYLKGVEFIGFKSFCDKTLVQFNPGITCIVGPNGCGKSNISDAIRWVLGERSAKLLRGSKMEDVIFSGTSLRKPLNMAEVSLIIDNRDKILTIGYDEVVLTRRLYRSGESEYLINKTPCRYKDIQDLIMDTGIGSHSYSMIEQGRIDHILQADPEERRFLIEEAAGISRYKSQKDEAIRKLERTENNLIRLTDIVAEVERNIKYAERQAKRAEKYREHYENLKIKEVQKALTEKKLHEEKRAEIQRANDELVEKERTLTERVEELKAIVLRFEKEEEEKLQEIRFKEGKRFEIKSEIQNRQNSKDFNWEKVGEIKNQIQTLESEVSAIESNNGNLISSIESSEQELSEVRESYNTFYERYSDIETKCEESQNELEKLEIKENAYQDLAFERAGLMASLRNEIHRLEIQLATRRTQIKKTEEAHETGTEENLAFLTKKEELESSLSSSQSSIHTHQIEHSDLVSQLETLQDRIETKRSEKENLLKEFQELASRIDILKELESSFYEKEGLSDGTREKLESFDFVKSLYKELTIQDGYECVVEDALGSFLKSLTVSSVEELEKIENELQKKNIAYRTHYASAHKNTKTVMKMLEYYNSKFQKIKCMECDEEQIVFSHNSSKVTCNSCGNILSEPTGSKAKINGKISGTA